jgi:hypothetical protein
MSSEQAGQGRVSARFAVDVVREGGMAWVRTRTFLYPGWGVVGIVWCGGKRGRGSGIGHDGSPPSTFFAATKRLSGRGELIRNKRTLRWAWNMTRRRVAETNLRDGLPRLTLDAAGYPAHVIRRIRPAGPLNASSDFQDRSIAWSHESSLRI